MSINNAFALPIGTKLGNFKLLKVLGKGGFGISYLAHDEHLKRNVVLKECFPAEMCQRDRETGTIVPLDESYASIYAQMLADLKAEARTIASLNHENIIRVFEVFESNGSIFYVMPWLSGGSFRELIGVENFAPYELEDYLIQILQGLEYLHAQGIFHRDIKPENILLDENKKPILIDFGSAVSLTELAQTQTQGTFSLAYAPIEQISASSPIGAWTDFYALAATWYEIITQEKPASSINRLLKDDLKPLSTLDLQADYSEAFLASIDFNLSLLAENRCQTAREWLDWLLDSRKPVVKKRKSQKRFKHWMLYLVLIVCISIVFAIFNSNDEQRPKNISGNKNVENSSKNLYERVYAWCRIDDLKKNYQEEVRWQKEAHEQLLANMKAKDLEIQKRFKQLELKVQSQYDASDILAGTRISASRDALRIRLEEMRRDLVAQFYNFDDECRKRVTKNLISFNQGQTMGDVLLSFPTLNNDEASQLSRIHAQLCEKYSYMLSLPEQDLQKVRKAIFKWEEEWKKRLGELVKRRTESSRLGM